jgi:hypothetical protein
MNSGAVHGLSNQDLVTRHRTTREGLQYTIVYPHPAIRSMPPVSNTTPVPGWKEIRVAKDLPHQLQEDRNLLGLVEFLTYEIDSSPARFVYGGSIGTRKRLQRLLTQGPSRTSGNSALVPSQALEQPARPELPRRGIPMETALDSALADLDRTRDHLTSPRRHGLAMDLAALRGNYEEQGEADWIIVNNSQSTKEGASSPRLHPSTQKDVIRGLAALVAMLTGKLPEQEDIVYETSLTELGYRTRITLGCLDDNVIQGAPFSGRQDAVLSAAECAIGHLTDNCNFRMSPALGPQPELSQSSKS